MTQSPLAQGSTLTPAQQALAFEAQLQRYDRQVLSHGVDPQAKAQLESEAAQLVKQPLAMQALRQKHSVLALRVEQLAKAHKRQQQRTLERSRDRGWSY